MRKRILSVLLSLGLMASIVPTAAYALSFPDVDSNSGYAAAIDCVSDLGIIVGDSQGNFNPGTIVNRGQMAAIVCRVLGQTENLPKTNVFTDVPASHWANEAIGKASGLGVVNGYKDGTFKPAGPVTYEQAVTMIVRAIGEGDKAASYGGYPNGFLLAAQEKNLLNGIQAERGQGLSRGAVAMLLYNYYTTRNDSGTPGHAGEHTHNYVTQTVERTEERQIGTETVNDYAQVTIYGCNRCSFTTYDANEMLKHNDARYAKGPCVGANYWSKTTTEVVGTHEEPKYATRRVSELVRVCSICGQQA